MSTANASGPPIRLVMRLLLRFMVGAMPPLARWHDGDLVRGVVFLAIAQSSRRPGPSASPRAISVNSVAASLALPYETARRHVGRLMASGLAARNDQGVLIPEAVLRDAAFATYAGEVHRLFVELVRGLRAIGFDFDSFSRTGPESDPPADAEEPDLALRDVVLDFVLRMVECGLAAHDNDMLRALVFGAIMAANAEPYTDAPDAAWDYARLDQSPPEAQRRPIPVSHLAKRIGIPYETTRRCVAALLADGDIVRQGNKGVINPQVSPRDAMLHKSGALVMSRFVQFAGDLRRLGFDFATQTVVAPRRAA